MNFHMNNSRVKANKEKIAAHQEILDKLMAAPVPEMPSLPTGGNIDIK